MFTMWYLKEQNCIRQDDKSDYVITGAGVDHVEAHLPSNRLLYRLLKAAESGGTRTLPKRRRAGSVQPLTYLPVVVQVLLALLVIPAAIWDVRQRRVPNWLTLPGLLVGIGLNAFLFESAGLWMALKGLGLAFLIYFPLYLLRGMGAGDVKLMAAVGAIVGRPTGWNSGAHVPVRGCGRHPPGSGQGRFRKTFENIWLILLSIRYGHAPYRDNPNWTSGAIRRFACRTR